MSHDPDLKHVLGFDPLDTAEGIKGKDYHEDPSTSALGFLLHLEKGAKLEKMLSENDDSYFSIKFNDMMSLAGRLDFVEVYREQVKRNGGVSDTLILMWNSKGILLRIESYGESTNTANIHFNLKLENRDKEKEFFDLGHISGQFNTEHSCWIGTLDVREAFRYFYEEYMKIGEFMPVWVEEPWMHVNAYTDYDEPYEINNPTTNGIPEQLKQNRLHSLPKHVQDCIRVAIK